MSENILREQIYKEKNLFDFKTQLKIRFRLFFYICDKLYKKYRGKDNFYEKNHCCFNPISYFN